MHNFSSFELQNKYMCEKNKKNTCIPGGLQATDHLSDHLHQPHFTGGYKFNILYQF